MMRPTLFDLNHFLLKQYPSMINLDKCTGSCNVLSPKICVPKVTKDVNLKVLNMITNKNEAKTMAKHFSCNCKCKFNSTTCNSNQKWNAKTCQCDRKNYKSKKGYSCNPSTCIWENKKYLKSIADISMIQCDEIITVMDIVSTKMTNTIAANVTSPALVNCHSKKVRLLYFAGIFIRHHIAFNYYYLLSI